LVQEQPKGRFRPNAGRKRKIVKEADHQAKGLQGGPNGAPKGGRSGLRKQERLGGVKITYRIRKGGQGASGLKKKGGQEKKEKTILDYQIPKPIGGEMKPVTTATTVWG